MRPAFFLVLQGVITLIIFGKIRIWRTGRNSQKRIISEFSAVVPLRNNSFSSADHIFFIRRRCKLTIRTSGVYFLSEQHRYSSAFFCIILCFSVFFHICVIKLSFSLIPLDIIRQIRSIVSVFSVLVFFWGVWHAWKSVNIYRNHQIRAKAA